MKYLGIDYGAKRIGIAVSDADGKIAFPRDTIANMPGTIKSIKALVEAENIGFVVIGDARSYGGIPNPITLRAKDFAEKLKEELDVPIASVWEAGSSIEANRYDPDHEHNDAAAAAIILQRYLDMSAKRVE